MASPREHSSRSGNRASERRAAAVRRMACAALVGLFLLYGRVTFAEYGDVYSPCWAKDECLDINVGGNPTEQPNRGLCDTQHCFEQGGGCPVGGQGKCYANPPPVPLTVTIGSKARVIDVGDYIATVYN